MAEPAAERHEPGRAKATMAEPAAERHEPGRAKATTTRLAAWWFAPAPAERLATLRILIGAYALVYVIARLGELFAIAHLPASQFAPVGIVRVLGGPLPPAAVLAIAIATAALLVAFVAGAAYRVTAPLAALGLVWTLTYRSSWGMVFHTENLLVLHVIALAIAPAADAWAVQRRPASAAGYGWAIKLLVAVTVATYVLAGLAKLRLAGLAWIDGDTLRDQIAVDNLRKAVFGDRIAPLATPLLDHPSGFAVIAIATLVIELGAPVALLGGRIAHIWAAVAWAFHVGVVLMMNVWFPYPLLGFAFLPLFPIEGISRRIARLPPG
jgi:hypothetical protein